MTAAFPFPRGKVLGGTSSINALIYARGHPLDYDQWRQLGLESWGYDDVLPYFKKSEGNWRGGDEYHGGDGLLKTSPTKLKSPLYDLFAEAGENVGFPRSSDYNGAEPEGIARPELTVGGTTGRHRGSGHASRLSRSSPRSSRTGEGSRSDWGRNRSRFRFRPSVRHRVDRERNGLGGLG